MKKLVMRHPSSVVRLRIRSLWQRISHASLPSGRALWVDFPDKTVGRLRLCEHRGRMRPRQPPRVRAASPYRSGIGQRARGSLDPGLGSRTRGPDGVWADNGRCDRCEKAADGPGAEARADRPRRTLIRVRELTDSGLRTTD